MFAKRAEGLPSAKAMGSADAEETLRRYQHVALAVLAALVVMLLLSASLVRVSGAVVASGEVAVASKVKIMTHPTGGVIAAILVKEGQQVRAGDALVQFESHVAAVDASANEISLDQLVAQRARLIAERDGLSAITFPPGLAPSTVRASEQSLFALRRNALKVEQAQLSERQRQMEQQIVSYQAQITAYRHQQALIEPERAGVRSLWERKLVTINRLNELERTAVSLNGSIAALEADIAQARARMAEIRQQSVQLVQQRRSDAAALLAETEQRIGEQRRRAASASENFDRTTVRASTSGIVDQLAYTTIGSFIPAAQPILRIVPDGALAVEVRIAPAHREQLRTGQKARIIFPALNRQTTPDLHGRLDFISAEATDDPRTGQRFYSARVAIPKKEMGQLDVQLVQGMPAEIYIETASRSLLSFLTKPLADQFYRAFRES